MHTAWMTAAWTAVALIVPMVLVPLLWFVWWRLGDLVGGPTGTAGRAPGWTADQRRRPIT